MLSSAVPRIASASAGTDRQSMAHLRDKPARGDNAGRGSRFRRVPKTPNKRPPAGGLFHLRGGAGRLLPHTGNRRSALPGARSPSSLTMMVTSQPSLAHTRALASAISELILSILTVSLSRSATILYVIQVSLTHVIPGDD